MVMLIVIAVVVVVALGVFVLPGLGILGLVIGVVLVAAVAGWGFRAARRPDVVAREPRRRRRALPVGPRIETDDADAPRAGATRAEQHARERAREIQG